MPAGDEPSWAETVFLPAGGICEHQPSLRRVHVGRDEGGWRVTLSEAGCDLSSSFRSDKWVVTEPVTGSDARPDRLPGRLDRCPDPTVDVIFLETPHRLMVSCRLPERTFDARWMTTPPLFSERLARTCAHPADVKDSRRFVSERPMCQVMTAESQAVDLSRDHRELQQPV